MAFVRNLREQWRFWLIVGLGAFLLAGCEAAAVPLIPTERPTATLTLTPSPTRTPGINETPRPRPTAAGTQLVGGLTPTPLLGASPVRQQVETALTPTRVFNPNAPRIEFFTSDPLAVQPGGSLTLFWSARNVDSAVILRLNRENEIVQRYENVPPDGSLDVQTRSSERGEISFLLSVGEDDTYSEQHLTVPLRCPVEWFFFPPPDECASDPPIETRVIDQAFERGRMLYVQSEDRIWVLFNDGREPGWLAFPREYDPAIHAERDPNAPPEFIQPLRELGFLWRTNDIVRNRLGLGIQDATTFDGFYQTAPAMGGAEVIYISGADGNVLEIIPGNELWQLITP